MTLFEPSSTSKAGHHDIAEILLKVALNIKSKPKQRVTLYLERRYSPMM
jgi:hypothetical protein